MERGEGGNQVPVLPKSEVLDVMPLRSFPPISLTGEPHPGLVSAEKEPNTTNVQDRAPALHPLALPASFATSNNAFSAAVGAARSDGPVKRGPGRPKGLRNLKRPFTSVTTSSNVPLAAAGGAPFTLFPTSNNVHSADAAGAPFTSVATSNNVPSAAGAPSFTSFPTSNNVPSAAAAGAPFTSVATSNNVPSAADGAPLTSFATSNNKIHTNSIMSIPNFQGGISERDRETGNAELVSSLLMRFNAVKRRLSQIIRSGHALSALRTFKNLKLHTNEKKRIGSVPGVDVGDIFFLWGEMYLAGLHLATLTIEFMGTHENSEPLAISVISTGKYIDTARDPESIVCTGHGGTEKYGGGVPSHQELKRMNLSLYNALCKKTVVRVVRKEKDHRWKKVYIYDGLYLVTEMREDYEENNLRIFKFKLVRVPGQKPGFQVWKHIEGWKSGLVPRPGLILDDISFGAEVYKIPLVNEVDDEKDPMAFTYVTTLSHWLETVDVKVSRCKCKGMQCGTESGNCLCGQRNGCDMPYAKNVLVARRPMIFECGSSCRCSARCQNKMIQNGLGYYLEVFKTVECGWGLRSWDPIRAGSFICEYVGEVIKKGEEDDDDDFLFDSSRVYNSMKWNYEHELVGEKIPDVQVSEKADLAEPLVISARKIGNVARFINHSCTPNVLWQPMKREIYGKLYLHIGLFAMKHIPPMTELRYDYGASVREGKKVCRCGSDFCRGAFG
ncbi:unnamed protein product [Arabis nemorensis]|uniref:SET domain-containing protein n=1 Tax=Arabis nemorensis TaxID=586526 RepID=A0A565AQK1_9BRAS|nr:unnamed protein product [Arabis nemorensis]